MVLSRLSADASETEKGREIYRLVCKACHGSGGQGLTEAWRNEWAPEDQNCWQSKCHAANHPPEGFILPRYVPALIGPNTLVRFETALDLFEYIRSQMPWQAPGSLTDEEYWQLTAYLALEHDIVLDDRPLTAERAARLLLAATVR